MSVDIEQQCTSTRQHGRHVWVITPTAGVTVIGSRRRQCNGYQHPLPVQRQSQTTDAIQYLMPSDADTSAVPVMRQPPPPGFPPEKWAVMSRQQRRAYQRAAAKQGHPI